MKWYQNAVIGGRAMPAQRRTDTTPLRWERLLAPLVPAEGAGRLLVDLGCNAGAYCREARRLGYRAVGVEKDPAFVEQARYWEAREPMGVEIVQADITAWDMPACHVALLACTHYWLAEEALATLLERLRGRAMSLVVMGKHKRPSLTPPDRRTFLKRLRGWEVAGQTRTARHWALLARNPRLREMDTEALYARQLEMAATWGTDGDFFPAFESFVRPVLAGELNDTHRAEYGRFLRRRRIRYGETLMDAYVSYILSMRDEGLRVPLVVDGEGRVTNGNHRLVMAHVLGIEKVICQV